MSGKRRATPKPSAARSRKISESAMSIFDGANQSSGRGYIYFPTLDTRKEIDSYTHWELVKKARWFYANSGFARRCVNGIANMIGYLTPSARTTDVTWNALAEANFENRAGSAQVCDVTGKNNFYSLQIAMNRCRLKDGDLLVALTKTPAGGAAFLPYEANQIGNSSATDAKIWDNGVLTNAFSRHLKYRILSGEGHYDISAQDAIYYADFERLNQTRGLTGFAHAINHLHDTTEIIRDSKMGIKIGNQIGFYRTKAGKVAKPRSMGGGRTKVALGDGADNSIDLEQVYRGGKVPQLEDGEELKTLLDSRPHPNQMALLDHLVRDMSWGFGLSSEVLWNVGKINGTSNRFVLADAVKWIEQEQQRLVDIFCTRYWVYHIACEMKAGRLPACKDPDWWKVAWIPQKALTVDRGRDGKLNIDLNKSAMLTLSHHYNEQFSTDWKPNVIQWMDEKAFMRDGLIERGFAPVEIAAILGGNGGSLPAPQPEGAPETDPSEETPPPETPPPDDN